MEKRSILFLALFLVCFSPRIYAQLNTDVFIGTIVDRNILNFSESNENLSFKTINCGIEYQFFENFGLGLYVGYLYNSSIQRGAAEQGFMLLAYPINYGIKAIIGNIDNGFAVSLDIGINPTLGMYYKRFLMAVGWGYSEVVENYGVDSQGSSVFNTSSAIYPYVEVGYSIGIK